MVNWQAFASESPELAGRGLALLGRFEVAFLATIRKDGSPRLHPVVPVQAGDGLFVAISSTSPKARDLIRDHHYALHAMLGKNDEEFMIRGVARRILDPKTIEAVDKAASHVIHASDQIFEFLINACLYGYWKNVGQPDTFPVRQRWPG